MSQERTKQFGPGIFSILGLEEKLGPPCPPPHLDIIGTRYLVEEMQTNDDLDGQINSWVNSRALGKGIRRDTID